MANPQINKEVIIFQGRKFNRYPDAPRTSDARYFKGRWLVDGKQVCTRLHCAIWIAANGPIPKGFHVHHKDEDYLNNTLDNFELKAAGQHLSEHYHAKSDEWKAAKTESLLTVGQEAAKEWHKSDEGRAWHRQNAANNKEIHRRTITCLQCNDRAEVFSTNPAKFCSRKCKRGYNNHLPENVERRRIYALRKKLERQADTTGK